MDIEDVLDLLRDNECYTYDGLDDAIVGYTCSINLAAVYDYGKCVEIFMDQGMSEIDAIEFLNYNVVSAYIGDSTPVFITTIDESQKRLPEL